MEVNRIIGDAQCTLCGAVVKVKLTKKNLLYYICDHTSGGCGHQLMCRDPAAEKHLARRITKWVKREDRLAYLGNEALPAKARAESEPAPEPEPEPQAEPADETGEPEPIEEPEPTPAPRAPRRPPSRRPLPKPPAKKKKSALDEFFGM